MDKNSETETVRWNILQVTSTASLIKIGNKTMQDIKQNILLGITGSIAAYKTPELIRLLQKHNASIKVILTQQERNPRYNRA